ncbi:MAG: SoxR reducing system RseC family protein [Desulfohalobiaceae bacterium]
MSGHTALEQGQVVKTLPGSKIQIKVKKGAACKSCGHRSFCHPFGQDHMLIEALNPVGAGPGQQVEISMALENPKKAVAILYLIPLFFLILGAILGNALNPLGHQDASAVVFSMGFLVLAYLGIRAYSRRKSAQEPEALPTVTRIISSSPAQPED